MEKVEDKKFDFSFKPKVVPTLFDIHKSFDVIKTNRYNGVKGEFETRMAVFTNFILGKQCVLLAGSRSSGKSNIMSIVGTYAPNPIEIDQSSEKANFRDATNLNSRTHFIIPEINKINDTVLELLKDWGEGKDGSYKTLDEWKRPITFTIEVKPFISSLADENSTKLGDELVSRITTLHTNSSIEQNLDVIKDKLLRAQNPFKDYGLTPEVILDYQNYVRSLPDIKKINFIYVPGTSVISSIPPFFTDSRRDTDKYLSNTYGITLFHYYDRITYRKRNKEYVLVTPLDAWYNHIVFKNILIRSAMKCSDVERLILDILRKHALNNRASQSMKIKEIHSNILKNGITPSVTTVESYMKSLVTNGYVVKNDESRPSTYEASDYFKNFEGTIDWKKVVDACKENVKNVCPEVAQEYIRRFCGDEIYGIHPFEGNKVNILNYKEIEVKVYKTRTMITDFIANTNEEEVFEQSKDSNFSGEDLFDDSSLDLKNNIDTEFKEEPKEEKSKSMEDILFESLVPHLIKMSDADGLIPIDKILTKIKEDMLVRYVKKGYLFEAKPAHYKINW